MQSYWKKYQEAEYNFQKVKGCFLKNDISFEHCLNNFLSSAQSVFWILNKEFSSKNNYETWKNDRSKRLPEKAKLFKELRNISLKEGPIKHEGVIFDFDFGAAGIIIPPYAKVYSPVIDRELGKPASNKAQIETIDGKTYEVEPIIVHDFVVKVESDKKLYEIKYFLITGTEYLDSIRKEIEATETKFQ